MDVVLISVHDLLQRFSQGIDLKIAGLADSDLVVDEFLFFGQVFVTPRRFLETFQK